MMHILSRSGFFALFCVLSVAALSGCGRKPGLSGQKPLKGQSSDVALEAPRPAELDGKPIDPEPIAVVRPKRGFLLDPLL